MSGFARAAGRRAAAITTLIAIVGGALRAQDGSTRDTTARLRRYGHDLLVGTTEGLGWAAVDQWRHDPVAWGRDWSGYGRRAASDVGEFLVQETVTASLAAVMNRPLTYQPCACSSTGDRATWAISLAVLDPTNRGARTLAVPRIVGAYAGSFAQAAWRPDTRSQVQTTIVNGSVSLALGAAYNLFYEWRATHRHRRTR